MLHTKNKTEQKPINYGGARRMNLEVSQPEKRSCSVVWWYGSGYFCVTWWQQGEQAVAGIVF